MTCTSDAGISDAAARRWLRALELTRDISHQRTRILPLLLAEIARSRPEMPALLSHAECFTFKDLAQRANKYARWALAQGAAKGDVICLLMPNRPEYMAAWLGISSIGGIVALLNANLVGASLARCIDMAQPKHIIVTDELASQFESARPLCAQEPRVWIHSGHSSSDLALLIGRLSGEALASAQQRSPTIADPALLIYTSGTAGFPKAAYVSHERLMRWSLWFAGMMDVQPSDRLYDCLPMYHSVGGVVAPGAMLVRGASAVIAEKFSVQHFWDDIASWNCSLFQYIGELCRYLVHSPPHARERSHRLRLCCGNGLREDVWREFKRRYGIPQILEFYAATEGVLSLFNCEEKPGAIGRIPPFLHRRSNIALVQCEVETGELTRSPEGRCLPASSNEPGEAIVKVDTRPGSGARFEGYTDEASAQSKLARDVFEAEDIWFRSGDLMRRDDHGFFYFVDRVGDSFRWKGENVSTLEVAQTIMEFPGIVMANVYGVTVPGTEGRAGMAALAIEDNFELGGFHVHLSKQLAHYAIPLFLRITQRIDVTATFKPIKAQLMSEGFDPSLVAQPLYFHDAARGSYIPLDERLYRAIRSGQMRL